MRMRPAIIIFFLVSFICSTFFSYPCHAENSKIGVCKSPYIEVTRYKWEGNKWKYERNTELQTFNIDDIQFTVALDKRALTVLANGEQLAYLDYKKYSSDPKYQSKSRRNLFSTYHTVQGKRVMVRILNFAPEKPEKGGLRWCLLELYVESSQSACEAAGGTLTGGFPFIPLIEMENE